MNYKKDNSHHLKVEVYPKLLISQSKFSGPRKFTLRYHHFEIKGFEVKIKYEIVQLYSFF